MNPFATLLGALRDISFAAAQDQPRNRQGHFGSRVEDGAGGIGAGSAVAAEYGAQIAAARRFKVIRHRIENWLRGSHDPAWGSDADNRAMVGKLDALIARNQLPGPLAVYVAYDGDMLSKLVDGDGTVIDRAYLYGSRQQSIARAGAPAGAYVARVLAPAGMNAYLFPEVSDPDQGILLPRGLTVTTASVNGALRTINATVDMVAHAKLADLLTAVRDVVWLFDDNEPRDDQGRWTDTGGGPKPSFHVKTLIVNGERRAPDGGPLPTHIQALSIPPAWTNVTYNPDPGASLLAQGTDTTPAKKRQSIYADSFEANQAKLKFARIQAMTAEFPAMHAQNEAMRLSENPRTASHADAVALISHTGIRPGSEDDTGAKLKAYGATTLEGQHVVQSATGAVSLQFVGKKGVSLNLPVDDPSIAKMLLTRKAAAGDGQQIFPQVSDESLREHVHTLGSGNFKVKDFRTLTANVTAAEEVAKLPMPKTQAEYKRSVLAVAKKVSAKLGNTPTVALQSYINPHVFASWKGQA